MLGITSDTEIQEQTDKINSYANSIRSLCEEMEQKRNQLSKKELYDYIVRLQIVTNLLQKEIEKFATIKHQLLAD